MECFLIFYFIFCYWATANGRHIRRRQKGHGQRPCSSTTSAAHHQPRSETTRDANRPLPTVQSRTRKKHTRQATKDHRTNQGHMDCTDKRIHNDNGPATVVDDKATAVGDTTTTRDDVPRPTATPMRRRGLHDVRPDSKIGWPEAAALSALFVLSLGVLLFMAYESGQHQAPSTIAPSPRPAPSTAWVALDDQPARSSSDPSVCRCPCQDSAGQAAKGQIVGSRFRAHCICQCALAMETVGPRLNPDRLLIACACVLGLFFPIVIIATHKRDL